MIVLLSAVAAAGDLRFDDAVRLALEDGMQAQIVAEDARATRAEAHLYASVDQNPNLAIEKKPSETTVILSVPLDFAAPARMGAASTIVSASDVRERAARSAVASAAGAAFLDGVRARALADLAADVGSIAARLRASGDARFRAGEIPSAEHALLLADAARALDASLSLQRDADAAVRRLAVLLGMQPDDVVTPTGWPDLAVPSEIDPTSLPAVLAADLDARAALKRVHAADLSLVPELTVSGGWQIEGEVGPVYGAAIALPLFAPGAARSKAAHAARDELDAVAELTRLDTVTALANARSELTIAEEVADAWNIPDLDSALEAAVHRYESGESALIDFVNERDLALRALREAVDARWRLQRARLALWELAGETPVENHP
jgi:outer membrane protein TolC